MLRSCTCNTKHYHSVSQRKRSEILQQEHFSQLKQSQFLCGPQLECSVASSKREGFPEIPETILPMHASMQFIDIEANRNCNHTTWNWIWPSHQSKCTSTYFREVQCSFLHLEGRYWLQQWSTQGTRPLLQGVHMGVWLGRASRMKRLSQGSTPLW